MFGYIYKVINKINNKIYIGKRKGIFDPTYYGSGKYIKNSINKYGKNNFLLEIIEYCNSLKELNEREKYWIKYYMENNFILYNISKGGDGGDTFYKLSDEDKLKRINKLRKNSYFANLTPEQNSIMRKKAWETRRKNHKDKHSEETRKKLSKSHLGKKPSQESVQKGIETKKKNNFHLSDETKKKISLSNKGKKRSLESIQKMINIKKEKGISYKGELNPFYGKHHSEETKKKISEYNKLGICGMKGKHLSEEAKKNHSLSMKGKGKGTKWMNDGKKIIKVKKEEIEYYISLGYKLGRKIEGKVFIPWNKGIKKKRDD